MSIPLTTTQKISVALGVAALCAIGVVVYFYNDIWEDALRVQEKKHVLAAEYESIKLLSDIKNQSVEVQKIADILDAQFIEADTPVQFIELIEKSARRVGVEVIIQNVGVTAGGVDEVSQVSYNYVNMTVRVAGSFDNVNAFLRHFQNIPHHIDVEFIRMSKISVQQDEESVPETRWIADISFRGIKR